MLSRKRGCYDIKLLNDSYDITTSSFTHILYKDAEGDLMRICELKEKEVINSADCKILGFVCDVDIDIYTGRILAIIVPGPGKIFSFLGRDNEYIIPYECICKVGADAILVNVCEDKVLCSIQ